MSLLTKLGIFIGSVFYKYAAPTALLFCRRRGGGRFGARHGRVFFHVAGGGPGGEFRGK
jgi:hypothetical protein